MKTAIIKLLKELLVEIQSGAKNLKQVGLVFLCVMFLIASFPVAIVNFFNDKDFGVEQIMDDLGYGGLFNGIRHEKCLQSPPTSRYIKIVYAEVGTDMTGDEWKDFLNSFSEDKLSKECIVYDSEDFMKHLDDNFPSITDKHLENIASYIVMSENEGSTYYGASADGIVIDGSYVTACKTWYNPKGEGWRLHRGIDVVSNIIPAYNKPPIYSMSDGIVITSTYNSSYGHYVVIQHNGGEYKSLYAHLYEPGIHLGMKVKKGQQIGLMGGTGNVTGPHLHLELYKNNVLINPAPFVEGLEKCINIDD